MPQGTIERNTETGRNIFSRGKSLLKMAYGIAIFLGCFGFFGFLLDRRDFHLIYVKFFCFFSGDTPEFRGFGHTQGTLNCRHYRVGLDSMFFLHVAVIVTEYKVFYNGM